MSMSTVYPPPPHLTMMSSGGTEKKKKRPLNNGSQLLDSQENYYLFTLLGADNVSLSAAVVELLQSDGRNWKKQWRGVLSLVKDYRKRAYFLRLYDIGEGHAIWEFQLYTNFQANFASGCHQLLTFEGDNDGKVYGLNFASVDEAEELKKHLDKRRDQEKRPKPQQSQAIPLNVRESRPIQPTTPIPYNGSLGRSAAPSPFTNGVTQIGTMVPTPTSTKSGGLLSLGSKQKKKDKKTRIRKEDISNPTNFQHKAHVGWDQDSGFSNNIMDTDPMDETIKDIIRAAGKDPSNMSKKTIKFVYDFIEKYEESGGKTNMPPPAAPMSSSYNARPSVPVSQPISQWGTPTAPPPPPSRTASHQSAAPPSRPPPPPPAVGRFDDRPVSKPLPQVPYVDSLRPSGVPPPPPPPPPTLSSTAPPAPPPPPPALLSSTAPAAPPPPPSGLSSLPPPQTGRGNLLAEIQAGKQLRSVGSSEKVASSSSSRDDVMAQIRQGASLKHVDTAAEQEKRRSAANVTEMVGIAGALARALEERRKNMGNSDSEDDDGDSEERNDEWED